MSRFFITYVSFFIFLATLLVSEHYLPASISTEAQLHDYREMFYVKQGSSVDGAMLIKATSDVPRVANNIKLANHIRNLRVFVAADRVGTPALYLEQAKPHAFYVIAGPFLPSKTKALYTWTAPTTLSFYATSTNDVYQRFNLNVHELTWSAEVSVHNSALKASSGKDSDI